MLKNVNLQELQNLPIWVNWKFEKNKDGKQTKIPMSPNIRGAKASVTNSKTWDTYEICLKNSVYDNNYGVGIVFAPLNNGLAVCGIDVDGLAEHTVTNPVQQEILEMFKDTYAETSPSGSGIHILFLADLSRIPTTTDTNGRRKLDSRYYLKNAENSVECYIATLTNRYFTFTGNRISETDTLTDMTDTLLQFLDKYMLKNTDTPLIDEKHTEHRREINIPAEPAVIPAFDNKKLPPIEITDNEIAERLDLARNAKNGDKFTALYDDGDISAYNNDDSRADLALCRMLAFYLKDEMKVDIAFRGSALYRRKWERIDYRENTIKLAIAKCNGNFYTPPAPKEENNVKITLPYFRLNYFREFLEEREYKFKYDVISHKTIIKFKNNAFHELTDNVISTYLEEELIDNFSKVSIDKVERFLDVIVAENPVNPLKELIDEYANCYYRGNGNEDYMLEELYDILEIDKSDTLSRTLIRKWLMQCYCFLSNGDDGIEFAPEFVLVFQGRQGTGKTRLLQHLVPLLQYWGEGEMLDPRDKDCIQRLTAKWIAELGEIGSTMRKDNDMVKAFLTRSYDEYRSPYQRKSEKHSRRTCFCGTVNETEFLIDPTGSRRWGVIPLKPDLKIDYKKIEKFNTMDLWAQIFFLVKAELMEGKTLGECFRLTAEEVKALEERNASHTKPMKAEIEVLDVLYSEQQEEDGYKIEWQDLTVTKFRDKHDSLKKYSAAEIGKVLEKHGYTANRDKKNGRTRHLPVKIYVKKFNNPFG